jgi:hypothetical protein
MDTKVKSGREVLEDFFNDLPKLPNVDLEIANTLIELYHSDKFSDTNIKNSLSKLRESYGNKIK